MLRTNKSELATIPAEETRVAFALLRRINASRTPKELVRDALRILRTVSKCSAVGIRLKNGEDYPYYETRGFPAEFVRLESRLCLTDDRGKTVRDDCGNPVLECMCGNIICGRTDPSKPFFSPNGSFWTNSTSRLLTGTTEADRKARTRNRCNGEGYESVALIPLTAGNKRLGLLQFNDLRPDMFSEAKIAALERLAGYLAVGIAKLRAEESLITSEERYRRIVETTSEGIWMMDAGHNTVFVNPKMAEMLGRDPVKIIGCRIEEFIFPEDLPAHEERMKARHAGKNGNYEHRFRRADGSILYMLVTATAMMDRQGGFAGSFAMCTDISERKKAEQALKESEENFRLMFDRSPIGKTQTSLDLRFMRVNSMFCEITGYTEDELMKLGVTDLTHPDDIWKDRQLSSRVVSGEIDRYDIDKRYLRKDGSVIWVHVSVNLVRDAGGEPRYFLATIQDVNQRKAMEESLKLQYDLAMLFSQSDSLQETLKMFLDITRKVSGMEAGGVYLVDREHRALRLLCHEGLSTEFISQVMEYSFDSPNGSIVMEGAPLYATDELLQAQGLKHLKPLRCFAILPIKAPEGIVACLNLGSQVKKDVSTGIRPLLETIATQAGMFISRLQARDALRRSEETHRALLQGLPDVIMRFDQQYRHLWASGDLNRTTGISPELFVGKTHRELGFPEKMCEFWESSIKRVFETGKPLETEFMLETSEKPIIFDWRLVPEFDAQKKVSSVLSISRDLTAHRRAEHEYRTLFEKMLNGFALHEIICDEKGDPVDYRFLAVNPAFERMTGLRAEAVIGRTVRELLPNVEQLWIEKYGKVALTGEPATFENFSRSLNKFFSVTAFRPAPRQFACLMVDVTDRKRAEEQIAAALKEKEVLLREVNHRVKNNLQIIRSLTSLQADRIRSPEARHILLENQSRIAAISLVHEKLYQSSHLDRIDAGEYISSLVRSLCQSFTVDRRKVAVTVKVTPGLCLETDRAVNCGLIINEALTNALKHAFPGNRSGEVTVSLTPSEGGGMTLRISDNGIGLPAGFSPAALTSLGIQLLQSVANQIGTWRLDGTDGTTIEVAVTR